MTIDDWIDSPEDPLQQACLFCGLEPWSCVCSPDRPGRKYSDAEAEAARKARLTKHELTGGKK